MPFFCIVRAKVAQKLQTKKKKITIYVKNANLLISCLETYELTNLLITISPHFRGIIDLDKLIIRTKK